MSFSYSAGVITQTGTDTNLTGLVGLTGITTEDRGEVTEYIFNATALVVSGTLSFNALTEKIRFTNMSLVARAFIHVSAGTLTITSQKTVNSIVTAYPRMEAINFGQVNGSFTNLSADHQKGMLVSNASTANLSGYYFFGNSGIAGGKIICGDTNSTINLTDSFIFDESHSTNSQLRFTVGSVGLQRVTLSGISLTIGGIITAFSDVSYENNNESIVYAANLGGFTQFQNVTNINAGTTIRHNNNGAVSGSEIHTRFLNALNGIDTTFAMDDPNTGCKHIIANTVTLNLVDENFSTVSGSVYAVDVNNGRRGSNFTTRAPDNRVYNVASDIVYSGLNQSSFNFEVLSGVYNGTIGGVLDKNSLDFDARGVAGTGNINFKAISYNGNPTQLTPSLRGLGNKTAQLILVTDRSVTELTRATVDAYIEIDTSRKFYDRAKSYLVQNYTGQQTTLVTRDNNTIDLGSKNLTIDAAAVSVFAVDGSGNFTIKATNYVGNITTTGTVSYLNGATVDGIVIDTAGTSGKLTLV